MFFSGKGGATDGSFLLIRKETMFYSGPCSTCGERFSEPIPILGHRKGPKNQANYAAMKCCGGPACLSCSERQKAGKCLHRVTKQCLFCSDDGEKNDIVTTRQVGNDRTSIEWTIDFAEHLYWFEKAYLEMPYLFAFLKSMPACQRLSLGISWRTVKDQPFKDLYEGFLQRSQHLWRRFFARNLTFIQFARQCEQQLVYRWLFSNRMVRKFTWNTYERSSRGVHVVSKSVQRIPPEFICFCSRRMVVFEHSFQRRHFQAILRRVFSKFFFGSGVSRVSYQ
jgi:hypothetical protein